MTQRDLDRLRRGEIEEMPVPEVEIPPEPSWQTLDEAMTMAIPDTKGIEDRVSALIGSLNDLHREFGQKVAESLNAVSSEIRALKRDVERQVREVKQEVAQAKSAYAKIEQLARQQAQLAARQVRQSQSQPRPVRQAVSRPQKRLPEPEQPCWARSAEPAGKLNCGCQGAPVAYMCIHPEVNSYVTLHAASLRKQELYKPDGTTVQLPSRQLKPCSLCKLRAEKQEGPPEVSSLSLSFREEICVQCPLKPNCPIPATNQIKLQSTSCPDGRWTSE